MRSFINRILTTSSSDKQLLLQLEHLLGFSPRHIAYYRLALMHRSRPEEITDNNERLEFLGDAILGAIVGEYLFKHYPFEEEGFLTKIRSRIVNRESMGILAKKIGVDLLIKYDEGTLKDHVRFLHGNALEALIGAIYLDRGYLVCYKFVIKTLLNLYIDLNQIINNDNNYKSQIVEWGNSNHKKISFQITEVKIQDGYKEFTAQVVKDDKIIGIGQGRNRKHAEQQAAFNALETVKSIPNEGTSVQN